MIEAIIISTNYDDLLDITLPHNKSRVNRLIVGTESTDTKTIEICAKHEIEVILCDESLNKDGTKFNRGAAYNYIFQNHLKYKDWVLLLDSDILIGDINTKNLHTELFYGARRWNVETYEDYIKILEDWQYLNKDNFILYRGAGYGYFQLFNYKSKTFRKLLPSPYKEQSGIAEHDWIFRNNWGAYQNNPKINCPEDHRIKYEQDIGTGLFRFLPETVVHLGITGKNDTSRNTPRFK